MECISILTSSIKLIFVQVSHWLRQNFDVARTFARDGADAVLRGAMEIIAEFHEAMSENC